MNFRVFLSLPALLALALAVRAEEPPEFRAVLDQAESACIEPFRGGQEEHAFWDGCEPGTEVEYKTDSRSGEKRQEQTLTYRILGREGPEVKVHMKGEGADREFVCRERPPRTPGEPIPFQGEPVDADCGGETLTVGGREYACRIYERATKMYPECGTGEPQHRIHRIRAWHAPGFPVQGGILKIVQTYEEEWGDGPLVKVETTFEVTDPAAKKSIEGVEFTCYAVTITAKQAGKARSRGEQFRLDTIPGGILDSTEIYLDESGEGERGRYRFWISRLSILRAAEIEKAK